MAHARTVVIRLVGVVALSSVIGQSPALSIGLGELLGQFDTSIKNNTAAIASIQRGDTGRDQRLQQLETDNVRLNMTVKDFAAKIDALSSRLDNLDQRGAAAH